MSADWKQAQCPSGVTRRILMLRHGETDASSRGRCYGKTDVPLSDTGREQVANAATLIAPFQPDVIISSPRIRALDSAHIVADAITGNVENTVLYAGAVAVAEAEAEADVDTVANTEHKNQALTVHTDDRFAELDFGDCEGKRYEEVERENPEFYAQWMANPTEVTFPNGESYRAMAERVVAAYEELVSSSRYEKILLVAHGGVNRIILSSVLGITPDNVFRLEQSYAALNCIDYYEKTPVLRVMNATP